MKKNVPGFNVFKARKCPDCGGGNYERSRTLAAITRHINGKTTREIYYTDAGCFTCLDCGFKASP